MKKSIVVLLISVMVFCLASCDKANAPSSSNFNTSSVSNDYISSKENLTTSDKNPQTTTSNESEVSSKMNEILISGGGETTSLQKEESSSKENYTSAPYTPSSSKTQGSADGDEEYPLAEPGSSIKTLHVKLKAENLYQYSNLTKTEKQAYSKILKMIKEIENSVDLKIFKLTTNEVFLLFQKVLTDYPEFFYVSPTIKTVYDSKTGIVNTLFIHYTDGEITDLLSSNGTPEKSADRNKINKQINTFSKKAKDILDNIPANYSAAKKERIIHDYLIKNVSYDRKGSESGNISNHSFTSYGALVLGEAVCEGYSKAFSFLCNMVGINTTLISGKTAEGDHMWNAVKLDNHWYMIDVTLDDGDSGNTCFYHYYNITTNELLKDHQISTSILYPLCNSTKHSYKNMYAINLSSGSLPENYKEIIDNTVKNNEPTLCLYLGEKTIDDELLIELIFESYSPVQKYIKEKGYNLLFADTYTLQGEYLYIDIVK